MKWPQVSHRDLRVSQKCSVVRNRRESVSPTTQPTDHVLERVVVHTLAHRLVLGDVSYLDGQRQRERALESTEGATVQDVPCTAHHLGWRSAAPRSPWLAVPARSPPCQAGFREGEAHWSRLSTGQCPAWQRRVPSPKRSTLGFDGAAGREATQAHPAFMAGEGEEKQGDDSGPPKPLAEALQRLVMGSGACCSGCMHAHVAAATKQAASCALVLISPPVLSCCCRPVGTPRVSPPGRAAAAPRVLGDAAGGAVQRQRGGGAFPVVPRSLLAVSLTLPSAGAAGGPDRRGHAS